jgi:hypothetical protein
MAWATLIIRHKASVLVQASSDLNEDLSCLPLNGVEFRYGGPEERAAAIIAGTLGSG